MKQKLFLASMAVAAVFASCTNDDDPANSVRHLKVNVEAEANAPVSRAIIEGTSFASGDAIGVWLYDNTNSTYDGNTHKNVKYTLTNNWAADAAPGLSSTEGSALAYYPYTEGTTDFSAISISAKGYTTTESSQTDWMYSSAPATGLKNSNPTADFSMKHAGAIIQLNLTKDDTFDATATLSKVSVKSEAFGTSATMNAHGGALTVSNTDTEIAAASLSATLSSTETSIKLIVLPVTTATDKDINVSVTINSEVYTAKLKLASIEQGKCYSFPLNLTATGMAVGTVSVTNWGTGTTGEGSDTNLTPPSA